MQRSDQHDLLPSTAMIRERLTYEDYVRIPDDGLRHEIIDGVHIVSPVPILRHQILLGELHIALRRLQDEGRARIIFSPVDLHLSEFDVAQPDIVAIGTEQTEIMGDKKIEGPPRLVVEVLSPSTARIDRGAKLELYARAGVREYWILDGVQRQLTRHVLLAGRYEVHEFQDVPVASTAFPGFELDLPAILDA